MTWSGSTWSNQHHLADALAVEETWTDPGPAESPEDVNYSQPTLAKAMLGKVSKQICDDR